MQEWQQLGEPGYRIERDLLLWKKEGMLLPEEVAGMMRLFQEMHAQHGYCLMLAPTGDTQQKPEVRRAFVDFFRQHADIRISVALYGGGAVTRAAVMLALGALRMTGAMRHIHRRNRVGTRQQNEKSTADAATEEVSALTPKCRNTCNPTMYKTTEADILTATVWRGGWSRCH